MTLLHISTQFRQVQVSLEMKLLHHYSIYATYQFMGNAIPPLTASFSTGESVINLQKFRTYNSRRRKFLSLLKQRINRSYTISCLFAQSKVGESYTNKQNTRCPIVFPPDSALSTCVTSPRVAYVNNLFF